MCWKSCKNKKVLKDKPVERVVFNAITKEADAGGDEQPARDRPGLVDAYLARRALDYLVGFNLSPVLWRKLPGARSAGRVQSVALRLVCDRELEIEKFVAREYWSLVAHLRPRPTRPSPPASSAPTARRSPASTSAPATRREAFKAALETRRVHGRLGRGQAGQAPSLRALHHLDLAAGGVAQARLGPGAHHADRAAAL